MYSATHSETVEELLEWPWRRFERFYAAYMQRSVIETLERRKDAMISALWSNSNYDDDKGTRKNAIEEIEASFDEAVEMIIHGPEQEEELDEDNPFLAPAIKATRALEMPLDEEGLVRDVVDDYSRHIDQ